VGFYRLISYHVQWKRDDMTTYAILRVPRPCPISQQVGEAIVQAFAIVKVQLSSRLLHPPLRLGRDFH
jgi:hypothetical protein